MIIQKIHQKLEKKKKFHHKKNLEEKFFEELCDDEKEGCGLGKKLPKFM